MDLLDRFPPRFLALIAAAAWGFNFVAVKLSVEDFSPFLLLTLRFLLVAVLLLPFSPKPPIKLYKIFIIALTFGLGHIGCMYASLHMGLSASVGIVVEQIGVPFSIMLAFFFFKEKPKKMELLGVLLAIFGTFVLSGAPNSIGNPIAFLLMMISGFFWAFYSIELKYYKSSSALGLVAWISVFAFFISLCVSLLFEQNQMQMIQDASMSAWLGLGYTLIFASIVAHSLWGYLMTTEAVSTVMPAVLLVPVFGVFGGVFFLNEPISYEMMVGSLLMILGVKMSFFKYKVQT